ncbi:MAG: choice-of-anchor F family protein [Proteobacteria bacterium]|nr:choice-of-anchor F family protein [Pseudomonadota bacterium]
MIKRPLIKAMAVAGFSAGMLVSAAANAVYTEPGMPAIQSGFPSDMADWMANPTNYSWNPENVRRGKHSDRPDDVVYIFLNKTAADAWWDGLGGTPPAGIPDTAVAYMHWALDNGTGMFPGIMAMSDDTSFKTNNCIMASGTTIPTEDGTSTEDKQCGNYQGASKRFKLVILKADQPIDLIFNTTETTFINADPIKAAGEVTDLVYDNYDLADVTTNIFRNYRHIMKVGNGTATDTATEVRDGTRLAGIKVEVGFTDIGGTETFTASDSGGADGLTYELDVCIADQYFDIPLSKQSKAGNDCNIGEVEVWLEDEFATFSPSMYAMVGDKRNLTGGYWDKNPAGVYPPPASLQTANSIDSGIEIDGVTGKVGAVTDNYFDVAATQAAGAGTPLPENMFGYMLQYGNFSDEDPGLIPMGIYEDDDGDATTEGELYAWWDGSSPTCCYRWGIDGDPKDADDSDAWGILNDADLAAVAARPLDENEILDPPRYEVAYMDDLGGLNVDTFIKIAPTYSVTTNPTFTVRFTGQSITDAGVAPGAPGTADGPWVAVPAAELPAPVVPVVPVASDDDNGLFGLGLSWMTGGLLALGLLLRRRRL